MMMVELMVGARQVQMEALARTGAVAGVTIGGMDGKTAGTSGMEGGTHSLS